MSYTRGFQRHRSFNWVCQCMGGCPKTILVDLMNGSIRVDSKPGEGSTFTMELDGLAAARLVRRNYFDKLPIPLFTAYDWVDSEREALEVGIRHFLPKPFFMSNF